jgi:uncharacterized membrane protein
VNRLPFPLLALTLAVAAAIIVATAGLLPASVASHFDRTGRVDGFQPRTVYLAVMLAITIGLPLLIAVSMGWVRRLPPNLINLPHRDYWLAASRREQTYATLQAFACVMGIITAVFCVALHLLVINANVTGSHELSPSFVALLVTFVAAMGAWTAMLLRRFRRPAA